MMQYLATKINVTEAKLKTFEEYVQFLGHRVTQQSSHSLPRDSVAIELQEQLSALKKQAADFSAEMNRVET